MNDNQRKHIKMIALDLDGTTLNRQGQLSERTIDAFGKAMAQGVQIVISTGRTFRSLPAQLFSVEGLAYVVTSNGAHITELATMRRIYENLLPKDAVAAVVSLLKTRDTARMSVETFV